MTEEEVLKQRAMLSPEAPPPYSGDTQLWAEDIDNYLRRRFQQIEERMQNVEAFMRTKLNSAGD